MPESVQDRIVAYVFNRQKEEAFGECHSRIGAWFLGSGLLPEKIILAVENHHSLLKAPRYKELAATIYFAEYLIAMDPSAGIEDGTDSDMNRVYDILKLKETDMVQFMVGVVTRKERIASFYGG